MLWLTVNLLRNIHLFIVIYKKQFIFWPAKYISITVTKILILSRCLSCALNRIIMSPEIGFDDTKDRRRRKFIINVWKFTLIDMYQSITGNTCRAQRASIQAGKVLIFTCSPQELPRCAERQGKPTQPPSPTAGAQCRRWNSPRRKSNLLQTKTNEKWRTWHLATLTVFLSQRGEISRPCCLSLSPWLKLSSIKRSTHSV